MKSFKHLFLVITLSLFTAGTVQSQCNTGISICQPGTAGPFGFNTPGTPVSTCLDFFGPSVSYITLHITSGGPLNLLIDGDATTGFLDVAIFNIPPGQDPCVAIENNANEIGCNYADFSNGCNQFGNAFPCTSSVPAPMVNAGDELMIVVENWSGASFTFNMDLGGSGAQTGPPDPSMTIPTGMMDTDPPTQVIPASGGGTFSASCGACIDPVTGMIDLSMAGAGIHTICYDIGAAPCDANDCQPMTIGTALSAEIEYVDLACIDNIVRLDWKTMTEDNCDYFLIERSRDAINYEEAATIKGAENSLSPLEYSFKEEAISGIQYYRISEYDMNGERTDLGAYYVSCQESELILSPNPCHDILAISYSGFMVQATTIQIVDAFGRILKQVDGNPNGASQLALSDLDAQAYTVVIRDEYHSKFKRFVKL